MTNLIFAIFFGRDSDWNCDSNAVKWIFDKLQYLGRCDFKLNCFNLIVGWVHLKGVFVVLNTGWPSVFYVFGISGIVWFFFWCIFVFDSPNRHPRIEPKELSYIQHSIGSQSTRV